MIRRILEYAAKTNVGFHYCGRNSEWEQIGLPSLRGFTPHLREVQMYSDQKDLNRVDLWVFHDLLHILFYDYATLQLGPQVWVDPVRFRELHLASELFAVLALDYHTLYFAPSATLTVDINQERFEAFKNEREDFPSLQSFEFCHALSKLYLEGKDVISKFTPKKTKLKNLFQDWVGHEVRYSEKQRFYTEIWQQDLIQSGNKTSKSFKLEGSDISGGVWELMEFLFGSERMWKSLLMDLGDLHFEDEGSNLFHDYPKYTQVQPKHLDFRLTELKSMPRKYIENALLKGTKPNSSILFLFFQLISHFRPEEFSKEEIKLIQGLSKTANNSEIPIKLWKAVQGISLELFQDLEYKPVKDYRSCFFLP